MANSPNHRYGPVKFVRPSVDSSIVVYQGDLVWLNTDDARAAGSFAWDTSEAVTQRTFADVFMGVSHSYKASGSADFINVDVGAQSVYEFTCDSATYEVGNTFGVSTNGSDTVYSQKLKKTSTKAQCVGFAVNRATSASTSVLASFASAYNPGSSNSNAKL